MRMIFIAPWWHADHPVLCDSLIAQKHQDWLLLLIHDGPLPEKVDALRLRHDDARIHLHVRPARANDWGHSLRAWALENLHALVPTSSQDLVVVTNADNYYSPCFCGIMQLRLGSLTGLYCDVVHSHRQWRLLSTRLQEGWIDCGCMVVRRDTAVRAGWRTRRFAADWDWISDMAAIAGVERFGHLPLPLFVHN